MQGTWVRSLVWEDPTCHGATKPVCHNYWAYTLEPSSHNYWALVPQLLKDTPSILTGAVPTSEGESGLAPHSWVRMSSTGPSLSSAGSDGGFWTLGIPGKPPPPYPPSKFTAWNYSIIFTATIDANFITPLFLHPWTLLPIQTCAPHILTLSSPTP